MSKVKEALEKTRELPPQTPIQVMHGLNVRRTKGGIIVPRLHFTANPERDTDEWKAAARREYTSDAAWQREMEIIDEAGGGELVFADTLVTYWDKIVITDPKWRPDPRWRVEAGFDHGKTNATALDRAYFDYDGNIIFAGEYYMPGKEVWQHAPVIKKMEDIDRLDACQADPTIFYGTNQQGQTPGKAQEKAKSIGELYVEQGIEFFWKFTGDRSDVSFAARVMLHWANLDIREPSLKIVCRNYAEKPQPGLHQWDCPNLVWELMRTRRVKLTAQQLLSRNTSEAIVDKDNHARDAMKYLIMSHPEPTVKTLDERIEERLKTEFHDNPTAAMMNVSRIREQEEADEQPAVYGGKARRILGAEQK